MSVRVWCWFPLAFGPLGLGYGQPTLAAAPPTSCVHIPESSEPSPGDVAACETPTMYLFDVAGKHYEYAKGAFQDQLRTALSDWAKAAQISIPAEAWVEFWLAVPEGSPEGTMARAVLSWPSGGLVAYLGLAADTWAVTSREVGVFTHGERYPASFGHQAETLLVKPAAGVGLDELHRFMQAYGAVATTGLSGGWEVYRVPALAEVQTAKAIQAAPDFGHHVASLELNAMVEWIALRQRAFAFSFSRP